MWGFQEIHWGGDPCGNQTIEIRLNIASEQRREAWDVKAQDDRAIVECTPSVLGRAFKCLPIWPEHSKVCIGEHEPAPRSDAVIFGPARLEDLVPTPRSWASTTDLSTKYYPDAVSIKKAWQPSEMIFVRVGCNEHVNRSIPGRDEAIKLGAESCRIRATVNQHSLSVILNQDCVSLANIKDGDAKFAAWCGGAGRGEAASNKNARPSDRWSSQSTSSVSLDRFIRYGAATAQQ
jgi:hypothetical protein